MDKNLIPKLRFHRALEGMSESELEHIASFSTTVQLNAGDVLFEPDQEVDALHLVMQGRLRVVGDFKHAKEQTLRLIGPGEHFGALGIVLNQPLPCRVFADQPTWTLRLPREDLTELLDLYPRVRQNLSHAIGTTLRSSLLEQTAASLPRFVAWIQFSLEGRGVLSHVANRLAEIDESVAMLTDVPDLYASDGSLMIKSLKEGGKYISVEQRAELLREVSDRSRVLIDIDGPAAIKDLEYLVDSCDIIFWVAGQSNSSTAIRFLRRVIDKSPTRKEKLRFVCLPNEHERVSTTINQYKDLVDFEFKVPTRTDGSFDRLQRQGVERLVHHLRGVQVGIALGGGAARGMAHLGVLKVLEAAGIYFDMISGTSAGALTGIPYASGYDADYCVDSFAHDLMPGWFFRMLPKGEAWYLIAKYRTRAWDRMLESYLYDWRLEQLAIPFNGVSVDLISGQQVVYESGDAIRTIVESINLPGISAPICRDGMALIDGGTLNNLPADVLVNRGCNFVVAVSVSSKIQQQFGSNTPDTPTEKMRSPGIRQTLARERLITNRNMNAIGERPADFCIEPDVSKFALTDFPKTREIAAIGESAAQEAIEDLRQSLIRLDEKLFAHV